MIPNSRDENFTTKQGENGILDVTNTRVPTTPSTSTPWSKLRDPRIVRVSRALGGKDRHSKVCTVRGLKDRRIRLSVPTAIQLYDLQDRLGLNQPSKVVDWLLNVAKHEIDELPPLQIPVGTFGLDHHHQTLACHNQAGTSSQPKNISSWNDSPGIPKPDFWNLETTIRDKSKKIATGLGEDEDGKKDGENSSSINFSPGSNRTSLLNNPNGCNSFYCIDPSNFSLPQMEKEDLRDLNVVPLPPKTMPQVLLCPPYFPSHVGTSLDQYDPKYTNHFMMLSSSSNLQDPLSNSLSVPTFFSLGQEIRPLHLSMGSTIFGSEDCGGSKSNNNSEFSTN